MTKITIKRPMEWFNRFVSYSIVDEQGKVLETLGNGNTKSVTLQHQNSTIRAKMSFVGSKPVKVSEGKMYIVQADRWFHVSTIVFGPLIIILGMLISNLENMRLVGTGVILAFIIWVVLLFVVRRDSWLELKEER